MIFNTLAYYVLFLIPASIVFRFAKPNIRPWICALSGILFYIYFSVTAVGGVFGAFCVFILVWESFFSRFYKKGNIFCRLGICISILILFIFKYWNFATDLLIFGMKKNPIHWEKQFLPLGISFFTFEFIHFAVDRYKGKVEKGTLGEYLAFIFFFPTMIAGPIKRFSDFVECLRNPSTDINKDWNRGITRILYGLAKKFAIADFLTCLTDHLNVKDIALARPPILLLWLFAYGIKIYVDFSAYSDIAIGSGRLFGIKIPENFDWPYARTNITDFWRHWHISLYKWLVDYVFIPLGGSRGTKFSIYRNILLVMLVSGIWHGAGLNFVIWGLWHGVLLVLHRLWSEYGRPWPDTLLTRLVGWILTFISVNIGWAFFVMDMSTVIFYFRSLFIGKL
ncbi:MBOAT family O-acyltransferase [Armatimonas sp.]|uniref:MBOAT family O-acyltransferase n=1 Tax=Armatimonas sp. TaxID=1872638 RepID=UPI00286D52C4|nr:MBOAT family O-acyltransferase [Armatimonas sp.]